MVTVIRPLPEVLAEIDALLAKMSPLPWDIEPDQRAGMSWNNHIVQADRPSMTICFMSHTGHPDNSKCQANAEYLVAVANLYPQLREAAQDRERMREALKESESRVSFYSQWATKRSEALKALLERYTSLVNCGDCGNWNPEKEPCVIEARAALARKEG